MHRHANRLLDNLYLLLYTKVNNEDEIRQGLVSVYSQALHTHSRSVHCTEQQPVFPAALGAEYYRRSKDNSSAQGLQGQAHLDDQCFRSRYCLWLCVYTLCSLSDCCIYPTPCLKLTQLAQPNICRVCFRGKREYWVICMCVCVWIYVYAELCGHTYIHTLLLWGLASLLWTDNPHKINLGISEQNVSRL